MQGLHDVMLWLETNTQSHARKYRTGYHVEKHLFGAKSCKSVNLRCDPPKLMPGKYKT